MHRELNDHADVLSHPVRAEEIRELARDSDLRVVDVDVPASCWASMCLKVSPVTIYEVQNVYRIVLLPEKSESLLPSLGVRDCVFHLVCLAASEYHQV